MDAVERFAAEAVAFREWARHGSDDGTAAARNALHRILRLYLAGLQLPAESPDELEGTSDTDLERVSRDELRSVREAAARIPLGFYGEIFDPLPVPPEEPVVGDLADDIEDIYHDVVRGLQAYEQGQHALAVWEWRFHLRVHWGEHATSAIRALHCWLAENDFDGLTAGA